MSNDKIKTYKNPARSRDNEDVVRQPYVPQYQVLGLDPKEHETKTFPANILIMQGGSSANDNPRTRRPSVRMPYAEVANVSSQIGNDPIPNVGNSLEQTWSAIDGEIIDDITGEVVPVLESNIIQNDDYVQVEKISDKKEVVPDEQKLFMTKDDLLEVVDEDINNDLLNIPDNQYILILKGKIFHIGSMKDVENLVSAMVFGEPPYEAVPIEDIIVLKKIKLKIGLFLE
jgi:hypothetical protein